MTDINPDPTVRPSRASRASRAVQEGAVPVDVSEDARLVAYVELLFFAYRDFTGEADEMLSAYGFGRAHHRILHFVNRRPGLRVADLLDILKITKQSLARVLKQLVDEGFVVQRTGEADRRERLLFTTPKGAALARQLAARQTARIRDALALAGTEGADAARRFLAGMIGADERARIERLIGLAAEPAPAPYPGTGGEPP